MSEVFRAIGRRILRATGLERAGASAHVRSALAESERRVRDLKAQLAHARSESQTWKTKLHSGTAHLTEQRKSELQKYEARTARLEQRLKKELARIAERDAARQERLSELRDKVQSAETSVRIGRDHLMAIEVKLDVLEGAINVLDRRFRAVRPAGPDGAVGKSI